MLDGSGNGLHGAVGTDVQAGGAAYRFPVVMAVNGVVTGGHRGATGTIANTVP
jgi:hypothetical protein